MNSYIKTVDLLLLKRYGQSFLFLFMLFLAVAFVLILFDSLDDVMDASAPLHLSALYFLLRLPHEILKVTPLVAVIAMTITIGDLIRHHEFTMLLIAGYSPVRLLAPLAAVLFISVFALFFLYENIAGPASTLAHKVMESQIKNNSSGMSSSRGIWVYGDNNRIYFADTYLSHTMEIRGFTMFVFQGDHRSISKRFDAESATYQPNTGTWTLRHVTSRIIHPDGSIDRDIVEESEYDLDRTPQDFERVTMDEELMSHSELTRMVDMMNNAGENPRYYLADLRIKEAFPFALFFLGVLTFQLMLYFGSAGRASGIGTGLLLVVGYYMALSLGKSLIDAGVFTPWFGAWYPNLTAFTASVYFYIQLRKIT